MGEMTSWKKLIREEMGHHGENWRHVEGSTLTPKEMNQEFWDGYGSSGGVAFTLWTKNRVYFPVVYDGAEWVGSVPRNPCDEKTGHQGGQ